MFQTLRLKTVALLAMLLTASTAIHAQIGEHRNDLAIGSVSAKRGSACLMSDLNHWR